MSGILLKKRHKAPTPYASTGSLFNPHSAIGSPASIRRVIPGLNIFALALSMSQAVGTLLFRVFLGDHIFYRDTMTMWFPTRYQIAFGSVLVGKVEQHNFTGQPHCFLSQLLKVWRNYVKYTSDKTFDERYP